MVILHDKLSLTSSGGSKLIHSDCCTHQPVCFHCCCVVSVMEAVEGHLRANISLIWVLLLTVFYRTEQKSTKYK